MPNPRLVEPIADDEFNLDGAVENPPNSRDVPIVSQDLSDRAMGTLSIDLPNFGRQFMTNQEGGLENFFRSFGKGLFESHFKSLIDPEYLEKDYLDSAGTDETLMLIHELTDVLFSDLDKNALPVIHAHLDRMIARAQSFESPNRSATRNRDALVQSLQTIIENLTPERWAVIGIEVEDTSD